MYQTDLLTRECVGPLHHTASTSEEEEEGQIRKFNHQKH